MEKHNITGEFSSEKLLELVKLIYGEDNTESRVFLKDLLKKADWFQARTQMHKLSMIVQMSF